MSVRWSRIRPTASFHVDVGRVDGELGVGGLLVRIGDAGELADQPGAGLGVEALAITRLAHLERGGDVDEDEPAGVLDHGSHVAPHAVVRSDRRADGDAPGAGDLGGDESDAADVQVAVLAREAELGREVVAHQIAVEERDAAAADLPQSGGQRLGHGRLAGSGVPRHEHGEAALVERRIAGPQLGVDLGHDGAGGQVGAAVEALAQRSRARPPVGGRGRDHLGRAVVAQHHLGQRRVEVVVAPASQRDHAEDRRGREVVGHRVPAAHDRVGIERARPRPGRHRHQQRRAGPRRGLERVEVVGQRWVGRGEPRHVGRTPRRQAGADRGRCQALVGEAPVGRQLDAEHGATQAVGPGVAQQPVGAGMAGIGGREQGLGFGGDIGSEPVGHLEHGQQHAFGIAQRQVSGARRLVRERRRSRRA